jgi:hypothetical protein
MEWFSKEKRWFERQRSKIVEQETLRGEICRWR